LSNYEQGFRQLWQQQLLQLYHFCTDTLGCQGAAVKTSAFLFHWLLSLPEISRIFAVVIAVMLEFLARIFLLRLISC